MDTLISTEQPVPVTVADGYVVVSLWRERGGVSTSYEYEHKTTLSDALDAYQGYEDGEYHRASAVGIFAVRHGMPVDKKMEPALLARLMKETRAR